MQTFWMDIRFAARMLRQKPGFTIAAVLSLALGIGACTAIFSVVDAVLLRALPYPDSERIVQLRELNEKSAPMPVAEPNYMDVRARAGRSFEALAQYSGGGELATVTGGSEPARAYTYSVSRDFFRVLGVQPFMGRAFLPEETRQGSAAVAIVSYGFWQKLLGAKTDLAGTKVNIGNHSFTVVGVMPPNFAFPKDGEVWIPREIAAPDASRTAHNWRVIARLRSGASLDDARKDVSATARQLKQEYGEGTDAVDMALVPLRESLVGNVRNVLLVLLSAVGLLLLIACANVANLLLARAAARGKELAVRVALGATRLRLARQFVTETVLLTLIAGTLGVLFSLWGVEILIGLNRGALPRADEIGVNVRALAFTLALSLFVAVVLGLIPALGRFDANLHAGLKEAGGRGGQAMNRARGRLRGLLVAAQIALTLMLMIGAGLLGKSFLQLLRVDPGFRPESAVAMDVSLPYPETEAQRRSLARFHRQLLERLGGLPGVSAVGGINSLPLTRGASNGTFLIDDNPANTGDADYCVASENYFTAMGIPLLRGRFFETHDTPDASHAALISQSLARKIWPDKDPIGQRIQFGNMDGDKRLLNVVGIVGDVRERGLDRNARPTIYVYYFQRPERSSTFSIVARGGTGAAALTSEMRRELQSLDPELPANFRTLDQVFSSSLDNRRFSLVLFGVFACVALLLSVTGIYGMMSYFVTQRTHEIGIRLALGAQAKDVLKLIVGYGMTLTLIGVAAGLAGALALTRLMKSLLYGMSASDPAIFVGITLLLACVALLACYIPARRATKVDPLIALRHE